MFHVWQTPTADGYGPLPLLDSFDAAAYICDGSLTNHQPLSHFDLGPKYDLSAWRVTITDVIEKPDAENPRKTYFAFLTDIRRVDVLESKCHTQALWTWPIVPHL